MSQQMDKKTLDHGVFLENIVLNLNRAEHVVCYGCGSRTPIWGSTLVLGSQYFCEACLFEHKLSSKRRRHDRWEVSVPFKCEMGDQVFFGFIQDLSEGGLGISHPAQEFPEGAQLQITLFSDQRLTFSAKVRHSHGDRHCHYAGLAFEEAQVESRQKVKAIREHFQHRISKKSNTDDDDSVTIH